MMSYIFKHVDDIFNKLLAREKDLINQAHIKMLGYILVLYAFFTGALIIAYSLGGETFHLVRVSIVFIVTILLTTIAYYIQ